MTEPLFIEVHEFVYSGDIKKAIKNAKPIAINLNKVKYIMPDITDGVEHTNICLTNNTNIDIIEKYNIMKCYLNIEFPKN